jgi:drug/metabolite transporter (DMT)-like permease
MPVSIVLFGVLSAFLAGVADFFAALVSRRLGSFRTLLFMVAASALVLLPAHFLWLREPLPVWRDVTLMFVAAGAALVGYLAFYRGLALGPVAVVSPIAACDGAVAALVGVLLAGETLLAGHFAAVALLVVGVALAATDLRELRKGLREGGKGPWLAVVTMFGFGIALAAVTLMAGHYRLILLPILLLRCGIFVQMLAAAGLRRPNLTAGTWLVLAAVGVGLLDTASLLAFAGGAATADGSSAAYLLGPIYGAYPVVTVLLSLFLLRERVAVNQWLGVLLVIGGTALAVIV